MKIIIKIINFFKIFNRSFFYKLKRLDKIYLYYLKQKINLKSPLFQYHAGLIKAENINEKKLREVRSKEYQIYSNDGSDGVINFIFSKLKPKSYNAVEIGAGGYSSNILFLNILYGWKCHFIDGSGDQFKILNETWNLKNNKNLFFYKEFIEKDNFDKFLNKFGSIDFLSIDIDGNDYYLFEKINKNRPSVIEIEYNSLFGHEDLVTEYDPQNRKFLYHPKIQFTGASLLSLKKLGQQKAYDLVYCTENGANAFFVDNKLNNGLFHVFSEEDLFVDNKILEERLKIFNIDKNSILKKIKFKK